MAQESSTYKSTVHIVIGGQDNARPAHNGGSNSYQNRGSRDGAAYDIRTQEPRYPYQGRPDNTTAYDHMYGGRQEAQPFGNWNNMQGTYQARNEDPRLYQMSHGEPTPYLMSNEDARAYQVRSDEPRSYMRNEEPRHYQMKNEEAVRPFQIKPSQVKNAEPRPFYKASEEPRSQITSNDYRPYQTRNDDPKSYGMGLEEHRPYPMKTKEARPYQMTYEEFRPYSAQSEDSNRPEESYVGNSSLYNRPQLVRPNEPQIIGFQAGKDQKLYQVAAQEVKQAPDNGTGSWGYHNNNSQPQEPPAQSCSPKFSRKFSCSEVTMQVNLAESVPIAQFVPDPDNSYDPNSFLSRTAVPAPVHQSQPYQNTPVPNTDTRQAVTRTIERSDSGHATNNAPPSSPQKVTSAIHKYELPTATDSNKEQFPSQVAPPHQAQPKPIYGTTGRKFETAKKVFSELASQGPNMSQIPNKPAENLSRQRSEPGSAKSQVTERQRSTEQMQPQWKSPLHPPTAAPVLQKVKPAEPPLVQKTEVQMPSHKDTERQRSNDEAQALTSSRPQIQSNPAPAKEQTPSSQPNVNNPSIIVTSAPTKELKSKTKEKYEEKRKAQQEETAQRKGSDITQRWTGKTSLTQKTRSRRKLTGINTPLSSNFSELKNKFTKEEDESVTVPEWKKQERVPRGISHQKSESSSSSTPSDAPSTPEPTPIPSWQARQTETHPPQSDITVYEAPKIIVKQSSLPRGSSMEKEDRESTSPIPSHSVKGSVPQQTHKTPLELYKEAIGAKNEPGMKQKPFGQRHWDQSNQQSGRVRSVGDRWKTRAEKNNAFNGQENTKSEPQQQHAEILQQPIVVREIKDEVKQEHLMVVDTVQEEDETCESDDEVENVEEAISSPEPYRDMTSPEVEPELRDLDSTSESARSTLTEDEPERLEPTKQIIEEPPKVEMGITREYTESSTKDEGYNEKPSQPVSSSFFEEDEDEFEKLRKLRENRFAKIRSNLRGKSFGSFDDEDSGLEKDNDGEENVKDLRSYPSGQQSVTSTNTKAEKNSDPDRDTSFRASNTETTNKDGSPERTSERVPSAENKPPEPDSSRMSLRSLRVLECKPAFIIRPRRQFVEEGTTAKFKASLEGEPQPEVTWQRNGVTLQNGGNIKLYEENGYHYLEIRDVSVEADKGTIVCTATSPLGCASVTTELEVFGGVRRVRRTAPVVDTPLEDVTGDRGQSVTLHCQISGKPQPLVTWSRDGVPVDAASQQDYSQSYNGGRAALVVHSLQDAHCGHYECRAANSLGNVKTNCLLTIRDSLLSSSSAKQSLVFTKELCDMSVKDGDKVTLNCEVTGSNPEVIWYKNKKEIKPCEDFDPSFDGRVAKMTITEVYPEDAGVYVCKAVNKDGEASTKATLTVIEPEEAPTTSFSWNKSDSSQAHGKIKDRADSESSSCPPFFTSKPRSLHLDEGTCARLECQVKGTPAPGVTWQRDGVDIISTDRIKVSHSGDTHVLEIPHTLATDAGKYTCTAHNPAGQESVTASLVVKKLESPEVADFRSLLKNRPKLQEIGAVSPTNSTHQRDFRDVLKNKVETKQRPQIIEELKDVKVKEGEAMTLKCKVIGVPTPDIKWLLNKKIIKEGGDVTMSYHNGEASLCMRAVSKLEEGEYMCQAYSEAGTDTTSCDVSVLRSMSKTASSDLIPATSTTSSLLDMDDEPPFIEDLSPENFHIVTGGSFELVGTYLGKPAPEVVWLRDRTQLQSGGRFHMRSGHGKCKLRVERAVGDDTGCYTLQVTSELGQDMVSSSVTVEDLPDPPVGQPAITSITGNAVVLSWSGPSYDGGSPIMVYKVEMSHGAKSGSWTTLTDTCKDTTYQVEKLLPNTEYVFRVSVANRHGFSEPGQLSEPLVTPESGMMKLAIPRQISRTSSESSSYTSSDPLDLLSPLSGPLSPLALMAARDDDFLHGEPQSPTDYDELAFEPRQVELDSSRKFTDSYITGKEIGKGRFGSVFKCVEKASGRDFAAKFIKLKAGQWEELMSEVAIMNELHHPKLLLLWDAFKTPREIVLVMEHVAGGELFERIIDDDYILTERECVHFMRQIIVGVKFMHDRKILHLDLKPENILCITKNSNEIKIIDFGLARKFDPTKASKVMFGTPEFVAPEVVNYDPISFTTDLWSVGVICYMLMSGLSPFMGENDSETFVNVTLAKWDFDDDAFDEITDTAKDFIENLLQKDPAMRPNAESCLKHKWLAQDVKYMRAKRLSTDKHKKYMAKRKWQKTGNAVRALGRMASLQKAINMDPTRALNRSRTNSMNSDSGSSSTSEPRSRSHRPQRSHMDENQNASKQQSSHHEEHEPQEPRFIKNMKDLEVTEGSSAKFEVKISGYPEPEVQWFKQGEEVRASRRLVIEKKAGGVHSLTITKCLMNDDAEYECRATNSEGVVSSHGDLFMEPRK